MKNKLYTSEKDQHDIWLDRITRVSQAILIATIILVWGIYLRNFIRSIQRHQAQQEARR